MRYKINGRIIRSENAAKPHTQQSKAVSELILSYGKVNNVLDFGCGKLRYSDLLTQISPQVTFVDSKIQLSRVQVIKGHKTTVKKYALDNYQGSSVIPYEELDKHKLKYELITCTNVISAIPCSNTLRNVLITINNLLEKNGKVIFVNQHRSSYFKRFMSGKKQLFGYIYEGRRGSSYYGIIQKESMIKLLEEHDFIITNAWISGESNFVEAQKKCS